MKKKSWNNQGPMDSFFHQPTPKRVASRMQTFRNNRGVRGMRKGAR